MAEVSHWAALPEQLAPEVRHLVDQLRTAKDRTGLSYAALGAKTGYSRSSWERYLNGKTLPPRQAVETLAKLSGTAPARLLALWELADRAWSGRDARSARKGRDEHGTSGTHRTPGPEDTGACQGRGRQGTARACGIGRQSADGAGDRTTREVRQAPQGPQAPPEQRVRQQVPPGRETGGPAAAAAPRPGAGRVLAVVGSALAIAAVVVLGARVLVHAGPERPASEQTVGECRGDSCTGRNPEQGDTDCWAHAGTYAMREVAGRVVELRISPKCSSAWARLVEPRRGDRVRVEAGAARQSQEAAVRNRSMYTMMVGIDRPSDARACFAFADGREGCTAWGSTSTVAVAPRPSGAAD